MEKVKFSALIRNFVIELIVYAILVVAYFLIVLRWLGEPLVQVFRENPALYAPIALGLIVFQGLALEAITSFLVARLGLERFE